MTTKMKTHGMDQKDGNKRKWEKYSVLLDKVKKRAISKAYLHLGGDTEEFRKVTETITNSVACLKSEDIYSFNRYRAAIKINCLDFTCEPVWRTFMNVFKKDPDPAVRKMRDEILVPNGCSRVHVSELFELLTPADWASITNKGDINRIQRYFSQSKK